MLIGGSIPGDPRLPPEAAVAYGSRPREVSRPVRDYPAAERRSIHSPRGDETSGPWQQVVEVPCRNGTVQPDARLGQELLTSLVWIARGLGRSRRCAPDVLVLILSGSPRGAGSSGASPAATSPDATASRSGCSLAGILLFGDAGVRLQVLLTFQGNDMYRSCRLVAEGNRAGDDALKESGVHGFWISILIFSVLAVVSIARLPRWTCSCCSGSRCRGARG